MNKVFQFLFTTPIDAGANTASGKAEVFHYWIPWIVFTVAIYVIWAYYQAEGRKRFFGSNALHKHIADRMTKQVGIAAIVAPFLMFGRLADSSLFSWRAWRYGWLVWLACIAIYWLYYFAFKYRDEAASYKQYLTNQRYIPQPRGKRRSARAAGVR